jgi:hypothetical protein
MNWAGFWTLVRSDGHKVVIAILALIHIWKAFEKHIKSLFDKEPPPIPPASLVLPPEGCHITITPLIDKKSDQTSTK